MAARIRVWDGLVRALHWGLAAAMATAWISGHWPPADFDTVHHYAGYAGLAAVASRLAWGFAGSRHARLAQFVRGPHAVLGYARALRAGHAPRYIGHNPLGGWMALLLWITAAALGLTGWLYTTEWLWGYAWLEQLHAALAWLMLALVVGHLGGVMTTSWRHRENLVAAMFSGTKRAPAADDLV
ncbi:MAG: cytochrome b/b6 domain-containing protein [Roseateles sp.]|uniref:cytochrome b/b6 domain-containing protein n=1 Tax=Roseateles sp. TaxID=1971397 RepID=UPI0040384280